MFKLFATVDFDSENARKVFALLRAIRECGADVGNGREVVVVYSRPSQGRHSVSISLAPNLRDYELAPIKDLLHAVEKLGANVEYL